MTVGPSATRSGAPEREAATATSLPAKTRSLTRLAHAGESSMEEEAETLARSSSAHGQSAGSERSWTHRLTICNGPCSHGGTMQTMPHLQWSERASVSPLPPRALDG